MARPEYLSTRMAADLERRIGVPVSHAAVPTDGSADLQRLDGALVAISADRAVVLPPVEPDTPLPWGDGSLLPIWIDSLVALTDGPVIAVDIPAPNGVADISGSVRLHRPRGQPLGTALRRGDLVVPITDAILQLRDGTGLHVLAGSRLLMAPAGAGAVVAVLLSGMARLTGSGMIESPLGQIVWHQVDATVRLDPVASVESQVEVVRWHHPEGFIAAGAARALPHARGLCWQQREWHVVTAAPPPSPFSTPPVLEDAPPPAPVAPMGMDMAPLPAPTTWQDPPPPPPAQAPTGRAQSPPAAERGSVAAPAPRTPEAPANRPLDPLPQRTRPQRTQPTAPAPQPAPPASRVPARVRLEVQNGVLECQPMLGVSVTGNASKKLQLVGSLGDVNRVIATLRVGGTGPNDLIQITVEIDRREYRSRLPIAALLA